MKWIALFMVLLATPAVAQDHEHMTMPSEDWQWSAEAQAFVGYNYQHRKFTDFDAVESQNWIMTSLGRSFGASTFRMIGMFSLEPFTLRKIGSPQVFQTGETFKGGPLIDYQHPHDLFMNLGSELARTIGATTITLDGYVVGPAPLGPPAFMHRPSAVDNPQSPLSHHYLDSTHISPGVVSLGIKRSGFSFEAGAFHGQEPDENRLDLDTAALDSYAVRAGWSRGAWSMQASGGHLRTPERKSPYDENRVTASASYLKADGDRSTALTAAFGQNREVFGTLEAYLLEGERVAGAHTLYVRVESVDKDILDAGFHPIGIKHTHRQSNVGAFTAGYLRNISTRTWGRLGVGGDITVYKTATNLQDSYGSPLSFHIFAKYNVTAGTPHPHVH